MVIDNSLDRYLSNTNKNLQVSTHFNNLNNYVEKNQQLNLINQQHLNDHQIDLKMMNNNQINDKTNLQNNQFKDSTHSINLPIKHCKLDDSEDENDDILEISPCGRWSKRREQVEQHDIPNLDNSYLAIDGEEGLEVVWNEVRISERKYLQTNESRINKVFSRLIQLNHNNIVKIHKYWMDKENPKNPRLIFITEYMSGGTLRLFLKKTRSNLIKTKMTVVTWRRWCTQILCALRYLHGQKPKSITHGNLNCDTIFISHSGLIKIGCVNPDLIHQNVKTMGANTMLQNFYLVAPEMMNENTTEDELNEISDGIFNKAYSSAVDIYSFGIVALELAAGIKNNFPLINKSNQQQQHAHHRLSEPSLEGNYFNDLSGSFVSRDKIRKAIDLLDNDLQKDFINRCLNEDPRSRPSAKELLFHPIIFEVPCLKVICANKILNNSSGVTGFSLEQIDEEFNRRMQNTQSIIAEIHCKDGTNIVRRICDLSKLNTEYLEKFFEEIKNGVYPLYAFNKSLKMKITKYMKLRRNQNSFKNLVESSIQLNQLNKENLNGLKENCLQLNCLNGDDDLNIENNTEIIDQLNNEEEINQIVDEQECQDEEDEYDQEEETRDENSQDVYEEEARRIEQIEITLNRTDQSLIRNNDEKLYCSDTTNQEIIILLKLDDKMNRKLSCSLSNGDNGTILSNELVLNGFINSKDRDLVEEKINTTLNNQNPIQQI